jgi:NitT/TauT family transport system substrate-binding protein/putative hydroxymethylpyrimidine transport system substrate-binding protein
MPARRHLPALAALTAALALVVAGCGSSGGGGQSAGGAAAPVELALDFTPNAVHAPLFAAVRTGADRRHGIRLTIRRPAGGPDSLKLIAAGRIDLGVLDIHDLGIARTQGVDVVGIAALVRRPLAALVARPPVRRPRDLEGRTVGVSGLPSDPAFVRAIVEHDGGDFSRLHLVTIGFNSVSALLTGRVDAAPVFWNAEGVALRERGVPIREFRVDEYGAPPYPEVVLVTSRRTLERKRDVLRRTLLAIRDGMRAVQRDPGAAVRDVAQAAEADDTKLIAAQLRAVRPVFATDLRLDRGILERWAAFDARIGITRSRPDVASAFDFSLVPRG